MGICAYERLTLEALSKDICRSAVGRDWAIEDTVRLVGVRRGLQCKAFDAASSGAAPTARPAQASGATDRSLLLERIAAHRQHVVITDSVAVDGLRSLHPVVGRIQFVVSLDY